MKRLDRKLSNNDWDYKALQDFHDFRMVDGEISPVDAVKAYHGVRQHTGIKPLRPLQQDLLLTTVKMSYR